VQDVVQWTRVEGEIKMDVVRAVSVSGRYGQSHASVMLPHNTLEPAAQSEIQIPGLIFCRL